MSARLAGLFVAALLGVLAVVGVALASLGPVALAVYGVLVVGLLAVLLRRAAALRAPKDTGRTCTCCTSTVLDPVEVR